MQNCDLSSLDFPLVPANSVRLGDNIFFVASKFQGSIFAQIRAYGSNQIRFFATTRGVSLKKEEFVEFIAKHEHLKYSVENAEKSEVIYLTGNLAVSVVIGSEGEKKVIFLKGSEKAKCIALTISQFMQLCDSSSEILYQIEKAEN
jgi:hypothetical protein